MVADTTEIFLQELEETALYDDPDTSASTSILAVRDGMTVHEVENVEFSSSRIDRGEGSCASLANDREADFLITDDLRALPELQGVVDGRVAISPIVLKALVKRSVLEPEVAKDRLSRLAASRDWLGAPIYRRALDLFDDP